MSNKLKDLCIYCDVTNKESVKKAFNVISSQFGGIDILISNAGTATGGSIAEVSDEILRKSLKLTVSNAGVRSVDKKGSFDEFLKSVKARDLSSRLKKLKKSLISKSA